MSAIKIQINNLEALERLIGGDSAFEFEIRNSIVQEFAQKHLKSLVPGVVSHTMQDLTKQADKFIQETFFNKVRDGIWNTEYELKPELKKHIDNRLSGVFEEQIRKIVQQKVSDILRLVEGPGYIESLVNRQIDVEIEKKAKEIVASKLRQLGSL